MPPEYPLCTCSPPHPQSICSSPPPFPQELALLLLPSGSLPVCFTQSHPRKNWAHEMCGTGGRRSIVNNPSSEQGSHAPQWLFTHCPHVIINHAPGSSCARAGRGRAGQGLGMVLNPSVSSTLKVIGLQGGGYALCLSPGSPRLPREVGVCQTS